MEDAIYIQIWDEESKIKGLKQISEFIKYWRDNLEEVVTIKLSTSG